MAGEIRLQWWREVLEGQRTEEARANPVAAALIQTLDTYRLARAPLVDLVEARTFDLYSDPFATVAELEAYAERTYASVMICAATLLSGADTNLQRVARHAAMATVVCGLLRSFPLRVSRGQLQVPLDVLERHSVQPENVFAGRSSEGLLAALSEMRALARDHFRAFQKLTLTIPAAAVPAFLPVALVPLYFDRMEGKDYDPFRTIIAVPQWRRQWALWRAARAWGA